MDSRLTMPNKFGGFTMSLKANPAFETEAVQRRALSCAAQRDCLGLGG